MAKFARVIGWVWFVAPIVVLAYVVWDGVHAEFLGFAYYFASWGSLVALACCGAWYLISGPGAKWVLRTAAIIVALYVLLMGLIAWSNAPFYGGHDPVLYTCLALVAIFCGASFVISGRNAA